MNDRINKRWEWLAEITAWGVMVITWAVVVGAVATVFMWITWLAQVLFF